MATVPGRQYLPGGIVRPVTITHIPHAPPAPAPARTTPPTASPPVTPQRQPGTREGDAWWETDAGKQQALDYYAQQRPQYQRYETSGGYYWGVTPTGMMERLNPVDKGVGPNPYAAASGPGVGAKPTTFTQPAPTPPPAGSSKARIRAYAESQASWERARLWASMPSDMSYTDRQDAIAPYANQLRPGLRESDIYQSLLRPGGSKERSLLQQYAQQQGNIVSSSGTLVPLQGGGYGNITTGEVFAPTTRDDTITQGTQYATTTQLAVNPFQGIPLLEQAAAVGDYFGLVFPSLRDAAKPVVAGGQQVFSSTPVFQPVYETGKRGLPDVGAIYQAKEMWASEQVKKLVPDEVFQRGSEAVRKYGPTILTYTFPSFKGPEMASRAISEQFFPDIQYGPATLATEHGIGVLEGIREEPLKTGLIFGATFALPAVLTGGSRVAARSPTFTRLAAGKYSRYVFGKVPVQSLATKATKWETVPVLGKIAMKMPVEFAPPTTHYVNLPMAAAEVVIGVPWAQSVIERTTGLPARLSLSSEGGRPRLTWDVQTDQLKTPSEGAYQLGRISGTEIAPAFGGLYLGMKATAKAYGWARTRGVPEINLAPMRAKKPEPVSFVTKIRDRFAPKKEFVRGGIGYEWGYPVSQKITEDSLMYSFREGTLLPRPDKIFKGAYGGRVQYVPEHAFLRSDIPGESYMWTGWEHQPTIGRRFKLGPGKTPREMTGQFGAPIAESYFTKASEVGDYSIIGWDLPIAGQPTLVRTQVEGFYPIPRSVRAYAETIKKTKGKEAYGKFINQWVRAYGKPGHAHLPLHKAEYEGVLPSSVGGKLTELEATNIPGFVRVRGTRVPIVRTKYTGMVDDVVAPAAKPLKGFDQLGRRFGGFHGRRTGTHGMTETELLNKLPYADRKATVELFNIARKIEAKGMEVPAGKLDLSLVERISPRYAKQVEKILREEGATIYGSAGRTGEMPVSFIKSQYGKSPADVDIRVPNFVRTAGRIQKTIKGSRSHTTPFGIEVQVKHGGEWQTVADVHPNKMEDFFGWVPSTVKRGGLEYEPLSQQIIRSARGTLVGKETSSGQWKWGPKPHRKEKDIKRFYADVQYLLSKQPKSAQVTSITKSMRELRKHPAVTEVIGKEKFRYGPGRQDYFAGYPLSYYRGKKGVVNIPAVGFGAGVAGVVDELLSKKPTTRPSRIEPQHIATSLRITPDRPLFVVDVSSYIKPDVSEPSMISPPRRGKSDTLIGKSPVSYPGISRDVSDITGTSKSLTGKSGGGSGISIPGTSGRVSGGSGGRSGISGGPSGISIPGISGGSGASVGRSGVSGGVSGISSYISGGSSSITRPPSKPPTFPPTFPPPTVPPTQPPTFPPTRRPTYFLEETPPKPPKLRLHFDVLASKWNIINPIPRPGGAGVYPGDVLNISNKQYSRKKLVYVKSLPFEQFAKIDVKVKKVI